MVRFLKFLLLSLSIFLIFNINVNAEEIEASNETTPGEQVTVEEIEKQDTSETEAVPTEPVIEESNATDTNDMAESLTNETSNDESNTSVTEPSNETTQVEPAIAEANSTNEDSNSTMVSEGNATVTDSGKETVLTTYENQTAKVIISKTNENGELISGAKLQIVDSNGNVVVPAWISDDKPHEVMLPNGTYKLQELEAPEGYVIAEDVEIIVDIKIPDVYAAVDVDPELCDHYQDGQGNYGVVLYYVEIGGVKQEVYCINQQLGTPDGTAYFDGEILDTVDIRNYTKQEVNIDAHYNQAVIDISDQDLDNQELYDKLVDIIYHRHKATSLFADLSETEIRYITELALKNYTNTGLTEVQRIEKDKVPTNYDKYNFYETTDGKYIWYLYPMYRSFVYLPDAPLGESIFTTNVGEGNAFGNLARHWSLGHNANTNETMRDKVARYYELFQYLVGDDNNDGLADHPSDMNLYIYSTETLHKYIYKGVEYSEPYQNLLGVTGYFEEVQEIQKEQNVTMVDKYSTEKRDITVQKVWDDKENYNNKRPKNVTIELYADNQLIDTVELNDTLDWTYTWTDLDVYKEGSKIIYTIKESEVPEYDVEITGDMDTVFIVTNSYYGTGGDVPPSENPKTADSIYTYIAMLLISLMGLTIFTKSYVKNNL